MPRRRHQTYTIGEKRKLLALFDELNISSREFCKRKDIPRSTRMDWLKARQKLSTAIINAKRKTLGGQGARPTMPFKNELLSFIKDVHREEHILTSMHMITYMKTHQAAWLEAYQRYNFSQRVPCLTKMPSVEMTTLCDKFAAKFWNNYHMYEPCDVINVDETAVHYEMSPGQIWAEKRKSARVDNAQKHSDQLTAVLTCTANVDKLPILFIVHGTPGDLIDKHELKTYPEGLFYDVQESAWMDGRCGRLGVMGPFKKLLRTLWLEEKPVTTAAEKRLAMIKRSIATWERIIPAGIKSSFRKTLPRPEIVIV
ncbi:hypothetical protein DYB35_014040 [Aphanomyces astaci]|uniref:DDE-1 domain-containing protein n=1 Tax=Aphanomyces astaci TaxID=112090 RepID=A0A418CTL1_APHAT|nr:hypothetical protein DYB35_014040 [Aphanomyces astaci]